MSRPRLLDLFCGAGGAAMGYSRAGFDVIGVDIQPQPDYPCYFIQADALEWLTEDHLGLYRPDAIHASPPCQRFTAMRTMWNHRGDEHPDLIAPTRELLTASGLPWVMENVPGAPMAHSIMLCGTMFGLGTATHELQRHRLFETSFATLGPTCQHSRRPVIGFYGDHVRDARRMPGEKSRRRDLAVKLADKLALGAEAMGIDWMGWDGLRESIPPAYTEFLGMRLLEVLEQEQAA